MTFPTYATRCGYDLTLNDAGEYAEPLTYRAWRDYMAGRREGLEEAAKMCDGYAEALGRDADAMHRDLSHPEVKPENRAAVVRGLLSRQSAVELAASRIRALPAPPPALSREDEGEK